MLVFLTKRYVFKESETAAIVKSGDKSGDEEVNAANDDEKVGGEGVNTVQGDEKSSGEGINAIEEVKDYEKTTLGGVPKGKAHGDSDANTKEAKADISPVAETKKGDVCYLFSICRRVSVG